MAEANIIPAEYLEQIVPDYKGNPLIEALPPIWSVAWAMRRLTVEPLFHDGERELDAEYRFHCIKRLFRYFQPLDTHIDIEQRISSAIRQGYVSRNPLDSGHARRLVLGYEAIQEKDIGVLDKYPMKSTSAGFTIIGISGVGKTTAVEQILSLYPQCIKHTSYHGQPLFMKQLVWLKIDCPFDGSLKGLCFSFFSAFDRALGTEYSKKLTGRTTTVDILLPKMTQISTTHGLGLLVVDEIQHLSQAKSGGSEKMLNFFVTLVNTIGVPVVLIGTTKAMSVLQSEFRQARRGSGQGDLLWDRMKNDLAWETMLRAMWRYQWTRKRTELTSKLKDAIYDESQGIIDIAVKLYAMAQIKAIATGMEEITERAIHEVASEKLRLVKPMLDALRSGDRKRIQQFEDIRPIDIGDYIVANMSKIVAVGMYERTDTKPLEEQAVMKLLEMDIPSKLALSCVRKAMRQNASAQSLAIVVRKAFKLALSMEEHAPDHHEQEIQNDDLRELPSGDTYEAMKESGLIADSDDGI